MTTKLTLTVEKATIESAKSYAKQTGRSLSEVVEKYLKTITANDNPPVPSKLQSIVGAVKLPDNFDEDAVLREYFYNKHL